MLLIQKTRIDGKKYELIPGFAEKYFKAKIEKEKTNLVNYLLLADVYLRNENLLEAHNTLTDALKIAPDNSFDQNEVAGSFK